MMDWIRWVVAAGALIVTAWAFFSVFAAPLLRDEPLLRETQGTKIFHDECMWGETSLPSGYRPPPLWQTFLVVALLGGISLGAAWWLRNAPDPHAF